MMKKIAGFFKILFLTVITGGLYGAYWIVKNMGADDDSPELSEEERKARRAQNNMAAAGLQYFRRR